MIRPELPVSRPCRRRGIGGAAALAIALLASGATAAAPSGALPEPRLEPAATPGAYCLPRGDGGLGAAGFAGAVAATALVARRRRRTSS